MNYYSLLLQTAVQVCSYIAWYPVLGTAQCALHFTPWQTCSLQCQLDFSRKHSAMLQLLFFHISTSVEVQLSELRQRAVNKIAQALKWQQEDSNLGFLNWESCVHTTSPLTTEPCILYSFYMIYISGRYFVISSFQLNAHFMHIHGLV